jgi:pimeloyl-ACP methyl ester carboxylesterase
MVAESTCMHAPDVPPAPRPEVVKKRRYLQGPTKDERARAAEFLARPQFHRQLVVPATSSRPERRVSYAVAGAQDSQAPTMLLVSGMMGSRYLATIGDWVGRQMGVRVVVVDRPGFGLSTAVAPGQRIAAWLETVPVLLRELGARHVALASHSCGVLYAANTAWAMPEILDPARPALYLFSPWVAPRHSRVRSMAALARLPCSVLNHYDGVLTFVTKVIQPPLAFSGAAFASSVASLGLGSGKGEQQQEQEEEEEEEAEEEGRGAAATASGNKQGSGKKKQPRHERDDVCRKVLGVSATESQARWGEIMKRLWKEDISGVNGEAMVCLQKAVAGSWGVCEDYAAMPDRLGAKMEQHFGGGGGGGGPSGDAANTTANTTAASPGPVLRIRTFWAETDRMVGEGGQAYFDRCFETSRSVEKGGLHYQKETVKETDHETLCLPHYGAITKALEDMVGKAGEP